MALRATLAVFAAALVIVLLGPLALTLTDAALSEQRIDWLAALGVGQAAPVTLVAFALAIGVLVSALAVTVFWLPLHALMDAAGLRGLAMYAAAGYAAGGAAAALIGGPWGVDRFPLLTLFLGGAAAGAAAASVFWMIRRPDWT